MKKIYIIAALMSAMSLGGIKAQSTCATPSWTVNKTDAICFGNVNGSVSITVPSRFLQFYSEASVSLVNTITLVTVVNNAPVALTGANAGAWATSNLAAGTYKITFTYTCIANASTGSISRTVILGEQPSFSVSLPATREVCTNNVTTGTRLQSVVNGRPISTVGYVWNNGATSSYVDASTTNVFMVTVTDVSGCTATASTTVTANAGPVLTTATVADDCGLRTGTATVTAVSQSQPLSYRWTNGATVARLSNLAQGGYTVSVTDSKGCLTTANANVPLGSNCVRKISGTFVNDANKNCMLDLGESGVANKQIRLTFNSGRNSILTTSDASGRYTFNLEPTATGPFIVTPVDNSTTGCYGLLPNCTNSYNIASLPNGQNAENKNFFYGKTGKADVVTSVSCFTENTGWFQFRGTIRTTVQNLGCERATGRVRIVGNIVNIHGTVVWDTYNYDVAPGQVQQFNHVESGSSFFVNCNTNIAVRTEVIPNTVDMNPSNNNASCSTTGCPFDPNNKLVNPVRDAANGGIYESDEQLNYIINFQNLGEAPAHLVRIEDVLDETRFDLSTFELLGSSHPSSWAMFNNKLVVTMNDINLAPKGLNEEDSKGYITFTIKRKPNLPLGTTIDNVGAIYFDYNEPVITNTAHSTIISPLSNETASNKEEKLTLVPNPTSSSATAVLTLGEATNVTLSIFNINGQLVKNAALNETLQVGTHKINLDIEGLASGTYIIQLKSASHVVTQKLIKQ